MTAEDLDGFLIGSSPVMADLREHVVRVARSSLPVLISGPTGAGKELVAQAIHRASGRVGRFVPLNVSAIPESMFADAMFGHVRGAFTNAIMSTPGYVREADGGTLFLDEISRLAMANQITLLRVVETRNLRPVGGTNDKTSDFRVVSATNEDLADLAQEKLFRNDLLHRLCAATVAVPALRDRREDICELSEYILEQISVTRLECNDEPLHLTPSALRVLEAHDWPGNVRELRSTIECAAYLGDGKKIGADDIATALRSRPRSSVTAERTDASPGLRSQLLALLDKHAWDTASVAVDLGVHRATVYRWIQAYGLPKRDRRSRPRRPASAADPVPGEDSSDGSCSHGIRANSCE